MAYTGIAADSTVNTTVTDSRHGDLRKVQFAWIMGGVASTTITHTIPAGFMDGIVLRAIVDPGTPAPKDNYDIQFLDTVSHDLMGGALIDSSSGTTADILPVSDSTKMTTGVPSVGPYSLAITGLLGSSTGANGTVTIFVDQK